MINDRRFCAKTKTRAEVRGGGRKPWRQKGTGRARVGSIRSPIWKGGGVVFGPTPKESKIKMSKKMRRKALFSALSNKLKTNKLILLDKIQIDHIKTKTAEKILNKLPIKEGKILLVLPKFNPKVVLSFRNLPYLKTVEVGSLNIVDVLEYDYLILLQDALLDFESKYLKNKSKKEKQKEKIKN